LFFRGPDDDSRESKHVAKGSNCIRINSCVLSDILYLYGLLKDGPAVRGAGKSNIIVEQSNKTNWPCL